MLAHEPNLQRPGKKKGTNSEIDGVGFDYFHNAKILKKHTLTMGTASSHAHHYCPPAPQFLHRPGSSSSMLDSSTKRKQKDIRLDYVFHRVLGEGRFGKVRRAVRKHDQVRVAVKSMLKKDIKKSEVHLLRQEVRAMQMLQHPNIVSLIDLYESPTHVHICMELCNGGELLDRITKERFLSEVVCADIMHQILSAIAYMHDRGITHRDLKPENLLLANETGWTVKVCDFGLSKFYDDNTTRMSARLGTVYYMSPEVLKQNYTSKCDLWSLGVILYVMLCGYPPFSGKNDDEVFTSILNDPVVFHTQGTWDSTSQEAKDFICKLLNRDEDRRLSAREALREGWILGEASGTWQVTTRALQSLQHFCAMNKFKRAAVGHMSESLSQAEIAQLEQEFRSIDVDLDGFITANELADAITRTKSSGNVAFQLLDENGDNRIDLSEFVRAAIARKEYLRDQRIAQTFSWFDHDKNGTISIAELKRAMMGMSEEEILDFVKATDLNGDNEIDLNEFRQSLLHSLEPDAIRSAPTTASSSTTSTDMVMV